MAQTVAGVVVGVVGLVGDPAFAAGAADGLGVGPRQAEQRPQIARAAGPDAAAPWRPVPLARYGPLVKRLRHRPLTPVTGVRFPHGTKFIWRP